MAYLTEKFEVGESVLWKSNSGYKYVGRSFNPFGNTFEYTHIVESEFTPGNYYNCPDGVLTHKAPEYNKEALRLTRIAQDLFPGTPDNLVAEYAAYKRFVKAGV